MRGRILIVEDDQDVRDLLVFTLRRADYQTATVEGGALCLRRAVDERPDLVLLDINLPDMLGTEVCRRLRGDGATATLPVVMLSARAADVDRILGFELGADDYVTKPFSPRELVVRIGKVIERTRGRTLRPDVLKADDITLDSASYQVTVGGKEVQLTRTEFKLLGLLMDRCNRVQTRERLLAEVWNYQECVTTRTVDSHVQRLRGKLGASGRNIETVRGFGYRLVAPET